MKVLSILHGYPPNHNAGAEWMLHAMNKFLLSRGHEVKVLLRGGDSVSVRNGKKHYTKAVAVTEFEGVEIHLMELKKTNELFRWADMVFTHLDMTGKAMNLAKSFHKPIIHVLHNTHHNDVIKIINPRNSYLIYNADWNKKQATYKQEGIVVYPPVDCKEYEVRTKRDHITLINCWENKGGKVLVDLAKELKDKKFLGVFGGYGDQIVGKSKNLTYTDNTPDIKTVYRKTGILIMPSSYESWGRVAIEAMSSGIPVIAHPTPGLKESLGDAGLFAHRDNIGEWIEHINALDNKEYYEKVSKKCKERACELTEKSNEQLLNMETFLEKIKNKGYV